VERITDLRVYQHHSLRFDRGRQVFINFEGRRLPAFENETAAVALFASGVRNFSRSLKYHRPRGLFCLSGQCSSCLMRIDDVPAVRACRVWCRDGMNIVREKNLGIGGNDLFFAADFVFPDHMDYHHMLTGNPAVNRALGYGFRKMAGLGEIPGEAKTPPDIRDISCDAAVIGGGPAGCEAALAAAKTGAKTVLVEQDRIVGGHLTAWPESMDGKITGIEKAASYAEALAHAGVRVLPNTSAAAAYYPEGFWALADEGGLIRLTVKRTVLAVGGYDRNITIPGNDLPNVFSARGLMRLVYRFGICPGVRVFLAGTSERNLSLARRLQEIGVRVTGICEDAPAPRGPEAWSDEIQWRGVPLFLNHRPIEMKGRFGLKGAVIGPSDGGGERVAVRCDLAAVDRPLAPSHELAAMAGCKVRYDKRAQGFSAVVERNGRTSVESIFAAGEMLGEAPFETIVERAAMAGETAGREASS